MNYRDALASFARADSVAQSETAPGSTVSVYYEYPEEGSFSATGQETDRYLHLCCAGSPTLTSPMKYDVRQGYFAVLLAIEKGGAQVTRRGRTCTVPAGSFVVITAEAAFTVLFTLLPCTHSFYVFTGTDLSLFQCGTAATLCAVREDPLSAHALDALRRIPAAVDAGSLIRMHALLTQLLAESALSGQSCGEGAPGVSLAEAGAAPGLPRYLDFLHSAIHTQYREPFSLAFYERQLGVSRYRLCREYSDAFGISPLKDLNRTRIRKARELLVSTGLQVQEISLEVGYENTNHFIQLFRQQTGMTPGAYRKASGKEQQAFLQPEVPSPATGPANMPYPEEPQMLTQG